MSPTDDTHRSERQAINWLQISVGLCQGQNRKTKGCLDVVHVILYMFKYFVLHVRGSRKPVVGLFSSVADRC